MANLILDLVWVLVVIAALYFLGQRLRTKRRAALLYSRVADLQLFPPSLRLRLADLPHTLLLTAFGLFLLAFLDPRLPLPPSTSGASALPKEPPTEGIALYFLLDQSGSMRQHSPLDPLGPTKVDMLKEETRNFITHRPDDLIGLVAFARAAKVISPLTLDHDRLLKELEKFSVVTEPNQDGTGIGYAIFKTVNLIAATRHFAEQLVAEKKPSYAVQDAIIVLITDGFQSPNPLDKGKWLRTMGMEEAAKYAQANDVKLYLINIEPTFAEEEFAPHRALLQRVAESTGGKLFLSPTPDELRKIYGEIDQLEKRPVPESYLAESGQTTLGRNRYALFPMLILGGLCALGAAIVLSTTSLREVP